MARRLPTIQSLDKMNESRNEKATQLGLALNSLGGSNPALTTNYARSNPVPTASIPVLEKAVVDAYENSSDRNARQAASQVYNDIKIDQFQRTLDRTGQEDLVRGTNSNLIESMKNPGSGRSALESYVNTPYTAGNTIKNALTDFTKGVSGRINAIPGMAQIYGGATLGNQVSDFAKNNGQPTITPELSALGFTEADLRRWREAKNEDERQTLLTEFAKEHPVISSINAVPENAFGSIANAERQIGDYITNQPLRERQTNADILRQAVNEQIDSNVGKFAYNTANSIGDMLFATGLSLGTAPLASTIMGMEKGNQTMNNAINRGLNPTQVIAEGGASAISTAITEAIPLEGIINGSSIWKNIFSEAAQEASEDIVDTAFDQLITGLGGNHEKSELRQSYNMYRDAGYEKNDALKAVAMDYVKQLALDAAAGGISGGLLGAGSNIVQGRNAFTGRTSNLNNESDVEARRQREAENVDIVNDLETQVEDLKVNLNPEVYNELIDEVERVGEERPELSPQLREIVSQMETISNSVRQEIAAQNAATIPNQLILEQQSRYDNNAVLNEGLEQRRQEINTIADEVEAEKNRIIDGLTANNPFAGESVYNFSKYIEDMKQKYPYMSGYLNAELNDVLGMSEDWITDFDNATVEIPSLTQEAQTDIQNTENAALLDQANQMVDTFENDINNGADRQTAYKSLLADLVRMGNAYPDIRNGLNSLVQTRINPIMAQPVQNIPTVNPVEEVTPEPIPAINRITRSELTNLRRTADAYKSKLSTFNTTENGLGKTISKYSKKLDAAYNAIANSEGEAQQNNIEKFNNLLNEINEKMNGETVNITRREVARDLVDEVRRITDGRRIRVTREMIKELGLKNDTFTQLNEDTYLGHRDGRMKFVEKGGTPIDSAYMEMYEMSNNMLPNPQSMAESDMLRALYDFIQDAKTTRDEVIHSEAWEDSNVETAPSNIVEEWEDKTNDILDKIENGTLTEEEYDKYANDFALLSHRKLTDEQRNRLIEMRTEAMNAHYNMAESAVRLDDDLKNMSSIEELQGALDEAIEETKISGYPINLTFFGGPIDEDLGRVQTGKFKTSETFTNTGEKSFLTDKQKKMHLADDSMLWEENGEKVSVDEAHKRLEKRGYDEEYDRLIDKDTYNNVDTDEAMMIWRNLSEEAMALDEKGEDSTELWQKAHDIFDKIQNESSAHASALQALAKWSRNNTAEGLLAQAESIITAAENGYNGFKQTENGWYSQIARETKGKTKQMDVAFIKEFLTEAKKLEGLDIDSREAKHIMANLGKLVNSRIPVSLREKITTILMDNMLGNFRTLITRNAGGNIGFNLMEQLARKPLSALIDKGVAKKTGTRTVSGLTQEGMKAYFAGAKEAIGQEIYDFANNIQSARSGENTLSTATGNNRQVFSNKNVLGKIGNLYNKLVKAGLSAGDRLFYEGVYDESMAEYKKMYKEGKFGDLSQEKFEQLAKAHARLNALEAVYQDNSKIALSFIKMKQAINELSQGVVGADVLSQFTMPFVKTPANIIERAIEYSPVGIIKNAVQTIREVNHSMTNNPDQILDFDQERFVTETARNLIGTVLFAVAIGMANAGKLTGGYSEDKDMRQAQKEAGMQEYALHNPLGLNADVDISWVPVLGNNMVAAAAAYDAASKPELTTGQSIGQGLTAGLKSQFESSMLQGLQRFFGGSGSFGNDGGDLLTNAVDTIKSGGTQLIPSLLRQTAAATDPYQRQLSGPNPDDYYANSILSAIPGLRQGLEPKIGRTGEPLEQNHAQTTVGRFLNNYINPANVTYGTEDLVRDEAMRLFDATQGDNRAFEPSVTMSELKVDDHVPTAQEFTQYQQAAYGNMNQAAQQLMNSELYANMTDAEKVDILANLYSAIKTVEKKNVLGLDKDGLTGAEKAYNENGTDGLIECLTVRDYLAQMGLQNNASNREMVLQALNEGGTQAAEQMVSDNQQLTEMFDGNTNMLKRYNHAAQYIPTLTPQSFEETFHAIDQQNEGESGYGSIKQSEIIDYLNQDPTAYTDEEAMQLWSAYLQTYTKIPVFNPNTGVWKATK